MRALLAAVGVLVAGLGVVPSASVPAAAVEAESPARPAVVEVRTIGHSVRGRPIRALATRRAGQATDRAGLDDARQRAAHHAGSSRALRDGSAIEGVDLWVVPTYNPDGLARGTRRNARGVDLNRNFPYRWKDLDGSYESGPRPASEPETRAMMAFLDEIDPRRVVSFHQPLHGVDTDTKDPGFACGLPARCGCRARRSTAEGCATAR